MNRRRELLVLSAAGACGVLRATPVMGAGTASPVRTMSPNAPDGSLSIRDFGTTGDGVTDDTAALQRAIDHVRDEGLARRDTSHVPRLVLPSGHYIITDTINTLPWIKLCSVGGVLLDFQRLPIARNGIVCRNENMLAAGDLCYPGNRSAFLDGSGGTISVLGPGAARADGWGIVMGNRDGRFLGEVRDAGGHNVVVTGWRGALRIDPVNTYLNAWTSCRFEQNREEAIYAAAMKGPSMNSGERMTFYDCTFSGSAYALNVATDSQDFVFDACSFDFLNDVIHFGAGSGYGTVALSHCHIEGIDRSIVNAEKAGEWLRVAIDHSIVLPRRWHRNGEANAPRQLIGGRCSFSAVAVEFRFEAPVQSASTVLIGDDVHVEMLNGVSFHGFDVLPSRNLCLNADAQFGHDLVGTPLERLSHWKAASGSRASAAITKANSEPLGERDTRDSIGGRALVAKASSASSASATFTLSAKSTFAVRPGDTLCAASGVGYEDTPGTCTVSIDFLSADGSFMSRAINTGSPGAGVTGLRTVVPAGATLGLLSAGFSGWKGELRVTTLAAWTAA